ncbi:hypothetical protein FGB62_330g03 [Gracilaria domingensis]|nr:hypothetical protein FGB62_330g03 [Gracilaria domingensis]
MPAAFVLAPAQWPRYGLQRSLTREPPQVIRRFIRIRASVQPPIPNPPLPGGTGIHAALLVCATAGIVSSRNRIGAALSPPLVSSLLSLALSNAGVVPVRHEAYTTITRFLVPLSLPLLLSRADLRRIIRETGRLFPLFLVATLCTVISTLLCVQLLPIPGGDGWKLAAALCARHIGGAVNFAAVVDVLRPSESLVAAVLAADNLVVAAYFGLLLLIAKPGSQSSTSPKLSSSSSITPLPATESSFNLEKLSVSLTVSSVLVFCAHMICNMLPFSPGPIPVVTLLSVLFATLFPDVVRPYHSACAAAGMLFTQLFFAVVGASSGSIVAVLRASPQLFLFCIAHIGFHFLFLMLARWIFRLDLNQCLLVSNAAVGGPTTAAAMAASKNWQSLVAPALLIGVFGYAIATFVGLGLGHFALR